MTRNADADREAELAALQRIAGALERIATVLEAPAPPSPPRSERRPKPRDHAPMCTCELCYLADPS